MKILVVIPTRDYTGKENLREESLARAVQSVTSQVIDSEDTVDLKIEIGETGPSVARNRGVFNAEEKPDVVAFLDDDDWWHQGYLKEALLTLEDNDVVISSSANLFNSIPLTHEFFKDSLYRGQGISGGSGLLITYDAFVEVGGFDEALCGDDVYDFCLRLMSAGKQFVHQPKILWSRDLKRTDSVSRQRSGKDVYLERLELLKKYLPTDTK